ncbi:hypothetical protein D3C85_13630 [compost metagenome]
MDLVEYTVEFYLGAATTGEHPDKWSSPGRDLPYLYRRKWAQSESSLYPSIDVWKRFGLVKAFGKDTGWRLIPFHTFVAFFGEERTKELLIHCMPRYLTESKDAVLDELNCPR